MLDGVDEVLGRSKWIRFSLVYHRGRWCATFSHERGAVYGKAWAGSPAPAIAEARREALEKTQHLKGGD